MRYSRILLLCIFITGCSSTDELATRPAMLPPLSGSDDASAKVKPVWYKQPQYGLYDRLSLLHPHVDHEMVYIADPKGRIRALNTKNGHRIWKITTGELLSGGLGGNEGKIFSGARNGMVSAFRKEDGELLWRTQVSSEVLTAPHASNGVLVIRTVDGAMLGLDEQTGKQIWSYKSTVPALTLRGVGSPVLASDRVVAGFSNGKLVALSLYDGKVLWETIISIPEGRSELERIVDIDAELAYEDDVVYAASYSGRTVAVNISTGRIIWSRDISSYTGLAVDARNVYITDDESHVWALDRHTGATIWKQASLSGRSLTAPLVDNENIVVGDYAGYLHWLSSDNGRLVFRHRFDDAEIKLPPIKVENTVFSNSQKGTMVAVRVGDI